MKRLIILIVLIILIPNTSFAETDKEIMNTTKDKFNISEFIKEAEKYTGDFLEDTDLTETLNQACSVYQNLLLCSL